MSLALLSRILTIPSLTVATIRFSLFSFVTRFLERFEDTPQNFLFGNPIISSMCEALVKGFSTDPHVKTEAHY
jgi:hypothetical protein